MTIRIVSIGDSFTEGMNDFLPDGTELGWEDARLCGGHRRVSAVGVHQGDAPARTVGRGRWTVGGGRLAVGGFLAPAGGVVVYRRACDPVGGPPFEKGRAVCRELGWA